MNASYFSSRQVRIFLADPDFVSETCAVKFTLTYEGTLKTGTPVQHALRIHFHRQLRRLWAVNPFLKSWTLLHPIKGRVNAIDRLREKSAILGGFQFVPLVSKDLCLETALDFRILRPTDRPGNLSDIDNQVGILFDALKRPQDIHQLGENTAISDDEKPLFVLVDDDKLITKISSVADELLFPVCGKPDFATSDVRVQIDVYIRPLIPHVDNVIFFAEDRGVWDHKYDESIPENLTALSNQQLRSLATQCIFRMQAMSANTESWAVTGQYRGDSVNIREEMRTRENIWRTGLQPKALALKREMNRRIYGEGPYPNDQRSLAIDYGTLAGPLPLTEAATLLDTLVRMLPP